MTPKSPNARTFIARVSCGSRGHNSNSRVILTCVGFNPRPNAEADTLATLHEAIEHLVPPGTRVDAVVEETGEG